jgi:hypothetical protein
MAGRVGARLIHAELTRLEGLQDVPRIAHESGTIWIGTIWFQEYVGQPRRSQHQSRIPAPRNDRFLRRAPSRGIQVGLQQASDLKVAGLLPLTPGTSSLRRQIQPKRTLELNGS